MTRQPINRLDRRPPMLSRRHIDVVLMEPQKCENIGTAARAMANMGLGRLVLVRPRSLNRDLIETTATSHAGRILGEMTIHQELDQALAPYGQVVGTTARVGNRRGPFFTPRQLAAELLGETESGRPVPTAILFGPERMGLATEDMRRCQKVVRIPTEDPETSSLNLAQAVLLIGYELIVAAGGEPAPPKIAPAAQDDLDGMYDDLSDLLVHIGFLPADNPAHWLMNIKKIFNRSLLTHGECNLWRGICRQMRWALDNTDKLPAGRPPDRES
ncbi:RNA methyltransferase [Deltaproteobacteria bacterium OttesenSCG-928-M10]|nr:RNA methyltransferase [Deltaproteobacteria bacterium OttesenSCG-928-M10]